MRAMFAALLAVFLLVGCTAEIGLVRKTDIEPIEEDIRKAKTELEELKKSVEQLKTGTPGDESITALRESQAALYAQGADLLKEAQVLSGRFDEYKFFIDRFLKETSAELEIMRSKLSAISKKPEDADMEGMKAKIKELEESMNNLTGRLSALETMSPSKTAESPEKRYEDALRAFNEKRYADAKQLFGAFLGDNPDHKLAGNAQFWLGETYYAEKDFENSIIAYQEVIEKYKGTAKAPAAMLKQAYAFIELKDGKAAKAVLGALIEKFPGTEQADAAKKRLATLK